MNFFNTKLQFIHHYHGKKTGTKARGPVGDTADMQGGDRTTRRAIDSFQNTRVYARSLEKVLAVQPLAGTHAQRLLVIGRARRPGP